MKLNLTDTTIRNAMDDYTGALETRTALKLSAYLFTRPSELRQMEWIEIDLESALWSIPASKMKAGRPHLVPLAKQAVALLEEIAPLTAHRRYVFPSRTDPNKPMSNNTVRQALRRLGYDNDTMTTGEFCTGRSGLKTFQNLSFRSPNLPHALIDQITTENVGEYSGRCGGDQTHSPRRRG